ncbi:MAG TPA: hypothetical protein VMR18_02390, partial [Candidatus Saccharimonadales bacterium]|nr:hypothetical protein [Candidatus Saccharimonadales bacterium]
MQPLFDLDKLHKQHRRKKIQNSLIAGLVLVVILVVGGALVLSHKKPTEHLATVTDTATSLPNTPSSSATPTSTAPSATYSNILSQEEAQDKAIAAEDEAQAQQDIKNAENSQTSLNSEAPPSNTPLVAPSIGPYPLTASTGDLNGTYYYAVTFVTNTGTETSLSPASLTVSPVNQEVWVDNIPTSSNSSVNERKIYRTMANGSSIGPYYLVSTITDNSTTYYYDNIPDS